MENFYSGNVDGTGSAYVKDGKFVVNKWSIPYDEVARKKLPLFDHMPYNGWTIAHVRAASHGGNTYNNTHPLIKGSWAIAHNGLFREYAIVKALMKDHTFIGQTDSEAAAAMWERVGRAKFIESVDSGVYLFLNKNGQLDIICGSGDLEFQNTKYGVLMASELPYTYGRVQHVERGDFRMSKKGKAFIARWEKKPIYYEYKKKKSKKNSKVEYYSSYNWSEDDDDIKLPKRDDVWMY